MDTLNDNAIMLRVKAGDLDKMSLLFERHHRALYGFLFHMCNQREISKDLTQDVFYRMLKYRHTFTEDGQFSTWMYHLARNVLKDQVKKNRAKGQHYALEALEESIPDHTGADTELDKKQNRNQLREAMQLLSEEHREALTLSRLDELRRKEVAEVLDISENTVKVRVYRAMKELKEIYRTIKN